MSFTDLAPTATLTLFAAWSLRAALNEVSAAFTQASGISVHAEYGPSGALRQRIEDGRAVGVFASADMGHPRQLVAAGLADGVVQFTSNQLCVIGRSELNLSSENLLDLALDPAIKLGTSTPLADPSGDYAWKMFDLAEALRPGAAARLKAKALQLVGGPKTEPIPPGLSAVPYMIATGKADLFIAYRTTATQASKQGGITIVDLPATLAVRADYGLVVLKDAAPEAARFALFILSEPGQAILAKWAFTADASA